MTNASPGRAQNLGLFLIIMAAAVDSLSGLFTRLVVADTWTMIFWRGIFAALFVFGFTFVRYRRRALSVFLGVGWTGAVLVLLNAAGMVAGLQSQRMTAVANFFMIFATAPFAAALLARLVVGERLDMPTLLAGFVGFSGVFVMMAGSAESGNLAGDLLACCVVVFYSLLVLVIRRRNVREVEPVIVMTVLASSLLALPFARPLDVTAPDVPLLVVFGFIQLGLGNILIFSAARMIPAAQSGLLGVLNSALAPFWVWLALGEMPPFATVIGGSIVMVATVGHLVWQLTRPTSAAHAPA
ncbi:MAG TPA: DMT family transporter [Aestuariivirgaceae bacterium]|nr:DMT family transporter [Aestuariivirgaceae bacterium]